MSLTLILLPWVMISEPFLKGIEGICCTGRAKPQSCCKHNFPPRFFELLGDAFRFLDYKVSEHLCFAERFFGERTVDYRPAFFNLVLVLVLLILLALVANIRSVFVQLFLFKPDCTGKWVGVGGS